MPRRARGMPAFAQVESGLPSFCSASSSSTEGISPVSARWARRFGRSVWWFTRCSLLSDGAAHPLWCRYIIREKEYFHKRIKDWTNRRTEITPGLLLSLANNRVCERRGRIEGFRGFRSRSYVALIVFASGRADRARGYRVRKEGEWNEKTDEGRGGLRGRRLSGAFDSPVRLRVGRKQPASEAEPQAAAQPVATEQTVTDDAGRTVRCSLPSSSRRCYYTSPAGQIFCFTLAPGVVSPHYD